MNRKPAAHAAMLALALVVLLSGELAAAAPKGPTITTVAGNGKIAFAGDGKSATKAALNGPTSVAVDAAGNMFIADSGNHRVRKVDKSGKISTFAGNGVVGSSGDGGDAKLAQLNYPRGVEVDAAGNVFIADALNHRIRKVDSAGVITTVAGNGVSGFSGDEGPATLARLYYPSGIAVDAAGNIFIADQYNHRIRKVNPAGVITTFAGNGEAGFNGEGYYVPNVKLAYPTDVAVDAAGNVFIADASNNRIRKVNSMRIINTIAGNGVVGFSGDGGPATSAQVFYPAGVAVDAAGNLFIADTQNHRARMVNLAGVITTVAGNGIAGFSGDKKLATLAQLNFPYGVGVDKSGNLFIADSSNHRVRKGVPPGLSQRHRDAEGRPLPHQSHAAPLHPPPDEPLSPPVADPRAGVCLVGSTPAWVVNLNAPLATAGTAADAAAALRVARRVSERGGGLRGVQAMALEKRSDVWQQKQQQQQQEQQQAPLFTGDYGAAERGGVVLSRADEAAAAAATTMAASPDRTVIVEVACNLLSPEVGGGVEAVAREIARLVAEEGLAPAGAAYFIGASPKELVERWRRAQKQQPGQQQQAEG